MYAGRAAGALPVPVRVKVCVSSLRVAEEAPIVVGVKATWKAKEPLGWIVIGSDGTWDRAKIVPVCTTLIEPIEVEAVPVLLTMNRTVEEPPTATGVKATWPLFCTVMLAEPMV